MRRIDDNWELTVQTYLFEMECQARAAKSQLSPGKQMQMEQAYAFKCAQFMHYVTDTFDTAQGFAYFLKAEACSLLEGTRFTQDFVNQYKWEATQIDAVKDAEQLAGIYNLSYSAVVEKVAYAGNVEDIDADFTASVFHRLIN